MGFDRLSPNGEVESVADELRRRIAEQGPISVADYMAAANAHYYATREPFGAGGDFVTAPEISQMFGELIGAWLVDLWQRAGSPERANYVELGPGRGSLALDALRVVAAEGFAPALHLVETSPRLRRIQAERLPGATWHNDLASLPAEGPLLIVANEFFDAMPVHQYDSAGRELRVGWQDGRFAREPGEVARERSPAALAIVAGLAERIAAQGGAALIVDYGHQRPGVGDTLQALRDHQAVDPFAEPGRCDLTAHVDFSALAAAAAPAGVRRFGPVTQGRWLDALDIAARAETLARHNPDQAEAMREACDRLTASQRMGDLFKALALVHPEWPDPAGFPETIVWRDATPADAAALAQLGARTFVETFGHLYNDEDLAAFLANHAVAKWLAELADPAYRVRLGEAGGAAVAYAKLGPPSLPFEVKGPTVELRQFYFLQDWQGGGAADALIGWAIEEAAAGGAQELYLSVFVDNLRARRFYARHGFEPVGQYHFMVGSHADDDIIMRLRLR